MMADSMEVTKKVVQIDQAFESNRNSTSMEDAQKMISSAMANKMDGDSDCEPEDVRDEGQLLNEELEQADKAIEIKKQIIAEMLKELEAMKAKRDQVVDRIVVYRQRHVTQGQEQSNKLAVLKSKVSELSVAKWTGHYTQKGQNHVMEFDEFKFHGDGSCSASGRD